MWKAVIDLRYLRKSEESLSSASNKIQHAIRFREEIDRISAKQIINRKKLIIIRMLFVSVEENP